MSEQSERKRVILSGIQPTGTFTLGNYIGAVRNWAKLQDEFDCLYMVADLHALTVRQDPAALRRHSREAAAMILASGVDPKRSILFVQSHVPAHTQLNWIFCCNAQFGELSRMTQFKDKSAKHPDFILLTDDRDTITRKFKRAVTDSEGEVRYDPATKPGVSNLMAIYHIFTGKTMEEIQHEFEGQGYGAFKEAVGTAVADGLEPIQNEYNRILADKEYVDTVLKEGAEAASRIANKMIQKVYRKVGLLQL